MAPFEYEIRVRGVVPELELIEMEGMRMVTLSAQTIIRGHLPDPAMLQGIINRLLNSGLDPTERRRSERQEPDHLNVLTSRPPHQGLQRSVPAKAQLNRPRHADPIAFRTNQRDGAVIGVMNDDRIDPARSGDAHAQPHHPCE